jgi:hypothetical protein
VAARWFWNDLVAIRSPSEIKHNLMAAKSPGEKKKKNDLMATMSLSKIKIKKLT